jgi:predicted Zn-dependent protease
MTADKFSHHCRQIEGYLELGLLEEAYNLLEDLPSTFKTTIEALQLHIAIQTKAGAYIKASYLAETLSLGDPASTEKALAVAHLRYLGGDYQGAVQWLSSMKTAETQSAPCLYLKAQCHGRLGELEQMKAALHEAFAVDESLKMKALDDPAFESVFW